MFRNYKLYVSVFVLLLTCLEIKAQQKDFWLKSEQNLQKANLSTIQNEILPKEYTVFSLDTSFFETLLNSSKLLKNRGSNPVVVQFPNEKGEIESFQVIETSVMEQKLQKKYPKLKSYKGKSLSNPSTVVYFSTSPYGVNAIIYKQGKAPVYIDPVNRKYIMYSARKHRNEKGFKCTVVDSESEHHNHDKADFHNKPNDDGKLREFRIAIATTGEYSQYHLALQNIDENASQATKKQTVMSALQNAITRVNSVYERDFGIRLKLINNNDKIIFLDGTTDNLTNDNGLSLIYESEKIINEKIGSKNYDIGHAFSTEGGGVAALESVCKNEKAQGATGITHPTGDPYHIDYVCHEIGHQFGATHIFNGGNGGCEGNRFKYTSVEPGSGSTIMGYAGLCKNEDIQKNSDPYFSNVSINQIVGYAKRLSCPTIINTNNSAPVVSELPNYTLPILTPFALSATATDSDNDNLTYTWEQLDTEIVSIPLSSSNTGGPAFRSTMPSPNPTRYFPNVSTVVNNLLRNDWEVLPSVSRTMKFVLTVRDNNIHGGRTSSQETTLTFNKNSGPFKVSSQQNAESWKGGSMQTITWDVANTDKSPINCSTVNILFSEDGGNTFSHTLLTSVPNNGSAVVFAPNINISKGRIKVESENNVFYAINKASINVVEQPLIDMSYVISAKDQTCPSQQDGSISILAQRQANFSVLVNDKIYRFGKNITIKNLSQGTYDFCITADGIQKKCFQKTILKGNELKIEEQLDYPKYKVTIKEGTPPFYYTNIGENKVLKISETSFEVSVKNGDQISVKTSVACEGTYSKTITEFEDVRAFPNPTEGEFEISVPKTKLQKVSISIFNTAGQLISKQEYPVHFKRILLNISNLPVGVYLAEVHIENKKTIKIIKK